MAAQLHVGNLDAGTTSREVREAFEAAGHRPREVRLVRDPVTGKRRGFGFVEFEDQRRVAAANDHLDGATVSGRKLSVQPTPGTRPTRFVGER